MPKDPRELAVVLLASLASVGCGDDTMPTSGGGGTGGTSAASSTSTSTAGSDEGPSGTSNADASGSTETSGSSSGTTGDAETGEASTTGDPIGPLDCESLCAPYERCDEGVFLTCQANCQDIVPPLFALDTTCGEASAAYFECRFTLSCQDAIDAQGDGLEPNPCGDLLDPYIDSCLALEPEGCDTHCDGLLACFEIPPTPENVDACAFECVLYAAYAAVADTAACDEALDDLLACPGEPDACVDMDLVGCAEANDAYSVACLSKS